VRNARFWVEVNGGVAKLTLRPGEEVAWHPRPEGWGTGWRGLERDVAFARAFAREGRERAHAAHGRSLTPWTTLRSVFWRYEDGAPRRDVAGDATDAWEVSEVQERTVVVGYAPGKGWTPRVARLRCCPCPRLRDLYRVAPARRMARDGSGMPGAWAWRLPGPVASVVPVPAWRTLLAAVAS
jgi:hypothetical protein